MSELQDALDVEPLVGSILESQLGHGDLFAQEVALSLVGPLIDDAAEEECRVEIVQLLPQLRHLHLQTGARLSRGRVPLSPHLEHGFTEEPHVLRLRLKSPEQRHKRTLELWLRDADIAAARTLVVGVAG